MKKEKENPNPIINNENAHESAHESIEENEDNLSSNGSHDPFDDQESAHESNHESDHESDQESAHKSAHESDQESDEGFEYPVLEIPDEIFAGFCSRASQIRLNKIIYMGILFHRKQIEDNGYNKYPNHETLDLYLDKINNPSKYKKKKKKSNTSTTLNSTNTVPTKLKKYFNLNKKGKNIINRLFLIYITECKEYIEFNEESLDDIEKMSNCSIQMMENGLESVTKPILNVVLRYRSQIINKIEETSTISDCDDKFKKIYDDYILKDISFYRTIWELILGDDFEYAYNSIEFIIQIFSEFLFVFAKEITAIIWEKGSHSMDNKILKGCFRSMYVIEGEEPNQCFYDMINEDNE